MLKDTFEEAICERAPCRSADYLKACREFVSRLPFCDAVGSAIAQAPHFNEPKNLLAPINFMDLFEIRDSLVNMGYLKFRCTTWCMYPVIKRGDMVNILPAKLDEMDIGDIAVFRIHGFLLGHRVIDKSMIRNRPCLITRPDRSMAGEDPAIFEDDLVGKVSSVIREGRALSTEKRQPKKMGLFFCNLTILYFQNLWAGQRFFKDFISYIQGFKSYRSLAAKAFAGAKSYLSFRLGFPIVDKASAKTYIYKSLKDAAPSNEDLDEKLKWHIIMDLGSRPIGYVNFLSRPKACPYPRLWISDIFVRLRYRGAGFGTILMDRAFGLLKELGIKEVFASPFIEDKIASNFFKSLGFEKIEKSGNVCIIKKPLS